MARLSFLKCVVFSALVTGCGGGGGGGGGATAPPPAAAADTTAPIITLGGDNPQVVDLNAEYSESGATADSGETVTIDASAVNTSVIGTYSVTYDVSDAAGNAAAQVVRSVEVLDSGSGEPASDTSAPVISVIGDTTQSVSLNAEYQESGATADTGESVVIDASEVNTSATGTYTVYYNVTDAAGNAANEVTRTINVVEPSGTVSEHSVLTSLVDNIVIPNYKAVADQAAEFADPSGSLALYCDALGASDEAAKLLAAQDAWKSLMQTVQKTELHIVGPAAKNAKSLRNRVHFYTEDERVSTCGTDTAVVKAHSEPDFDVAVTAGNQRSLSAIEYLLFDSTLDHTCAAGVSTVDGWNDLADSERKLQRCALTELLAQDVSVNATQVHTDWATYRSGYLDASEIGTNFELMTDGLFYFEKFAKSAKLTTPLGLDPLCQTQTCAESIESPFSETSLHNIKVNAEQLLAMFDGGLDDLADQNSSGWSATFKGLITAVVDKADAMLLAAPNDSIKQQVMEITSADDASTCSNAYANPDSNAEPQACTLGGLIKRVTDDLKVDFVAYVGVSVPDGVQGDTD